MNIRRYLQAAAVAILAMALAPASLKAIDLTTGNLGFSGGQIQGLRDTFTPRAIGMCFNVPFAFTTTETTPTVPIPWPGTISKIRVSLDTTATTANADDSATFTFYNSDIDAVIGTIAFTASTSATGTVGVLTPSSNTGAAASEWLAFSTDAQTATGTAQFCIDPAESFFDQ